MWVVMLNCFSTSSFEYEFIMQFFTPPTKKSLSIYYAEPGHRDLVCFCYKSSGVPTPLTCAQDYLPRLKSPNYYAM